MSRFSRRSFVLGIAAVATKSFADPSLAQFAPAAVPQRFSGVLVDVDRLHALGLGAYAEFVRSAVLAETRRAFADRLGGPGPRLVVRITGISMASYSGGGGGGRFGGGTSQHTDSLEGEALIVGRQGEILARYPQLSATSAASGGAWYDPASEHRRVVNLAQHYAGWLRRRIG
jgi:hypothetical protein